MRKIFPWLLMMWILILGSGSHTFCHEFGLKIGLMRSSADLSRDLPGITVKSLNAIPFGFFLCIDVIDKQLCLQPEINFSIKGFNASEMDLGREISSKYQISYVEIPILISFNIPLKGRFKPGVFIGPYFGFARKVVEVQNAYGKAEKRELEYNLKDNDNGLIFGGNVRYHLGSCNLMLDARYHFGLTNISHNIRDVSYDFTEDDSIKNQAFTVSLGLGFNFPKN